MNRFISCGLLVFTLLMSFDSLADLRQSMTLSRISELEVRLQENPEIKNLINSLAPEQILYVLDLDETVITQKEVIYNAETQRQFLDKTQVAANTLGYLSAIDFQRAATPFFKSQYRLVEDDVVTFIKKSQSLGSTVLACTAMKIRDDKLNFILKSGIDFEIHADKNFPEYAENKTGYLYAQNKAAAIDSWAKFVNQNREKNGLKKIETVIFIDNLDKNVEQVLNEVSQVKNVIGIQYTYFFDTTSAENFVENFKKLWKEAYRVDFQPTPQQSAY